MSAVVTERNFALSTFSEPFLLLEENRLAHTAVERLEQQASSRRSSLVFIYGPSGIGKTHLTRHFVRKMSRGHKDLELLDLTAAEFAAQFAEAADRNSIADFQQIIRSVDVLVCEDLQALADRDQTQWQFLWLIDEILSAGGKVLLTSLHSPGQLSGFLPRLVNRFRGGTCISIPPIDRAGRRNFLKHIAATHQIPMTDCVVELLADLLPVTPRELSATVVQLETTAKLQKRRLDIDFVSCYIDNASRSLSITIAQITREVARHFSVKVADLRSLSRSRNFVLPRWYAMFLSRKLTRLSYNQIGDYFGNRNHTTVVHACNRLREQLPDKPESRQHVVQILQKLRVNPLYGGE